MYAPFVYARAFPVVSSHMVILTFATNCYFNSRVLFTQREMSTFLFRKWRNLIALIFICVGIMYQDDKIKSLKSYKKFNKISNRS